MRIKRKNFILINIINNARKIKTFRVLIELKLSLDYIYYDYLITFNNLFDFQIKYYDIINLRYRLRKY